ncbi:EamA family transporter [Chloroflexota bacterium]
MNAVFLSIIGAFSYGLGNILGRRAVIQVTDATLGALVILPLSLPFFIIILIFTGQLGSVLSFSWQSYFWLSAAGIVAIASGGPLFLKSMQLIGANVTAVLTRVNPLVSVVLGIAVLGEAVTWEILLGVVLIVFGIILIGVNPQIFRRRKNMFLGIPNRAFLYGIGAGLAWGIGPILVKMGLSDSGSPIAGVFISYLAATIMWSLTLLSSKRRVALASMKVAAVMFFTLQGLFNYTAQLMMYLALYVAPVILVAPLFALQPVFILVLSFLFNRKLEMFGKNVIIGVVAAVVGTILLV